MGGKVIMPPTEIPGSVTMAQFQDPEGNLIGLIKSGSM
jgi:predicted enzyme related to lactoylglutathione lyase